MTSIDYFILAMLAVGGLLGYRDGLFKKILAIVSFIIGIIVATKLMNPLGKILSDSLGFSTEIAYILAFSSVFMVFVILQNIVFRMVGNIGGGLQFINRIGGVLIGIIQGSLVASLILVMLNIFDVPSESTRTKSTLYKPTLNIAPRLFDLTSRFLPESKSFYEELKKDLAKYKNFSL